MSLNLAQALVSCPHAVCHACDARYEKDHQLKETVTPSARLLLLVEGKLAYHYASGMVTYQAGDLWLVPQLTRRHWNVVSRTARLLWVEFVHLLPLHVEISNHATRMTELDQLLCEQIVTCWQEGGHRATLQITPMLQTLLSRYALNVPELHSADTALRHPAISKVLSWLASNLDKPIAIDMLHEQARLSANHFRKLFKQATDMSPTQYVQMLRLRKARYLLLTTDKTVQEVGFAVGYEDPLHFSKQYRNCWGISPKQDRASTP